MVFREVEEVGRLENSKEKQQPCLGGRVLCQVWIRGMHGACKGTRAIGF